MNSLWTFESHGTRWFDPARNSMYPDRLRRRPPGTSSGGLGDHLDPGTLDLWLTDGYQRHFRHLWSGDATRHDPLDASYRTEAAHYPGSTMCSAFRIFQGWTALSAMRRDQGVLQWCLSSGDQLPDDASAPGRRGTRRPLWRETQPRLSRQRALARLLKAREGIPDVEPGDTVWWHCDMIHSVVPVEEQQGWGNVMYIPATPWGTPNAAYAVSVLQALKTGMSAPDFPEEHYERDWIDRFTLDDLNEIGRASVGLD